MNLPVHPSSFARAGPRAVGWSQAPPATEVRRETPRWRPGGLCLQKHRLNQKMKEHAWNPFELLVKLREDFARYLSPKLLALIPSRLLGRHHFAIVDMDHDSGLDD